MKMFEKIGEWTRRAAHRIGAKRLPVQEEMERFGADGEDVIYRILRAHFSCVIRTRTLFQKTVDKTKKVCYNETERTERQEPGVTSGSLCAKLRHKHRSGSPLHQNQIETESIKEIPIK